MIVRGVPNGVYIAEVHGFEQHLHQQNQNIIDTFNTHFPSVLYQQPIRDNNELRINAVGSLFQEITMRLRTVNDALLESRDRFRLAPEIAHTCQIWMTSVAMDWDWDNLVNVSALQERWARTWALLGLAVSTYAALRAMGMIRVYEFEKRMHDLWNRMVADVTEQQNQQEGQMPLQRVADINEIGADLNKLFTVLKDAGNAQYPTVALRKRIKRDLSLAAFRLWTASGNAQ